MTEQQAKALAEWFKVRKGKTFKLNDDGIDCVVEALEKQIAKETVLTWDLSTDWYICPTCKVFLAHAPVHKNKKTKHCYNCGQCLNWEEAY